ncbi:FtsW/RodA/SpoVE family cell cycle protein [Massilia sp. H-1]|nr:FtsW/RodA/SpoVE family cell cycle protein [Massilia sp. H-1]
MPEAHTDFLMAVIGEELGLVERAGGDRHVLLAGQARLRHRAPGHCHRPDLCLGLVAKGIGIWIGIQTFINMGVNLGLLPTKGLTLPLMSYGGSGVMINCVGLAILLRIDYENRVLMRGGRP